MEIIIDYDDNATEGAGNDQSMFILTILEKKIKEMRSKFFQGSVTVLQQIVNDQEARVKLTNTQLRKLRYAAKNKGEKY